MGADQNEVEDEEGSPDFQVHLHYMVREPMAPPTTEPKPKPQRNWRLKSTSTLDPEPSHSEVKRELFPDKTEKVEDLDLEDTPKKSQALEVSDIDDEEATPSKKKQSFKGTLKD